MKYDNRDIDLDVFYWQDILSAGSVTLLK